MHKKPCLCIVGHDPGQGQDLVMQGEGGVTAAADPGAGRKRVTAGSLVEFVFCLT